VLSYPPFVFWVLCTPYLPVRFTCPFGFMYPLSLLGFMHPLLSNWVYAPFNLLGTMHPLFYVGLCTRYCYLGLCTLRVYASVIFWVYAPTIFTWVFMHPCLFGLHTFIWVCALLLPIWLIHPLSLLKFFMYPLPFTFTLAYTPSTAVHVHTPSAFVGFTTSPFLTWV
jgi:hypothetical protein